MPIEIGKQLKKDISNRHSLVLISGNPFVDNLYTGPELNWLTQAGINFKHIDFIDSKQTKIEIKTLIENASVIFLCGGYTIEQRQFLLENTIDKLLYKSNAIIIGTSAGAINMSKKWIASKYNRYDVEDTTFYEGLALSDFSFQPHFEDETNYFLNNELLPFSNEITIYAPAKNGALRVKDTEITIIGSSYKISNEMIIHLNGNGDKP